MKLDQQGWNINVDMVFVIWGQFPTKQDLTFWPGQQREGD